MEINIDGIQNISADINGFISSLEEQLINLNDTISEMKKNWESNESAVFFTSISGKYCSELENLISTLKNYQNFLKNVPGSYTLLDDDYGNKTIG